MRSFFLYAGVIAVAVGASVVSVIAGARAAPNAEVIVVVAPWADPEEAITCAGGVMLGIKSGWLGWHAIFPDPPAHSPGLWTVLSADQLSAICGFEAPDRAEWSDPGRFTES